MARVHKAADNATVKAGDALQQEARFSAAVLRRHGWRLMLVFVGLLLPLWGFAELADEIREQEVIPFDEPILRVAHALAREGFDHFFVLMSQVGYLYGVVPFDIALVLVLALMRRFREATFSALAFSGSAVLNMTVKHVFARERPALWASIAPETTFSFPSGHAMGSATLACVLILLTWRTRWRWPVLVVALAFTIAVGLSRIYLGVHYPSDILAGWAAASVWTAAVFLVVYRAQLRPWQRIAAKA